MLGKKHKTAVLVMTGARVFRSQKVRKEKLEFKFTFVVSIHRLSEGLMKTEEDY